MSATVHTIAPYELNRLRQLLDEAETNRTRLNRRIRRLRAYVKKAENGEDLPDIDELLGRLPRAVPVQTVPSAAQPPPRPAPAAPAPQAPANPPAFAGHFGEGLAPGVQHPTQPPPAAEMSMPSVDVGALSRLSPEQLDSLPFGVVTLDASGRVIGYNDTESRLAGLPRESVLGRNFFSEVAPCTRVREFEGRFRDFAAGRSRLALETFEFVFNFRSGAQRVVIMISPARTRGQFHVSMIRR